AQPVITSFSGGADAGEESNGVGQALASGKEAYPHASGYGQDNADNHAESVESIASRSSDDNADTDASHRPIVATVATAAAEMEGAVSCSHGPNNKTTSNTTSDHNHGLDQSKRQQGVE
ncbi:unnamed protein product, partial [Sphacelaria rigidula]